MLSVWIGEYTIPVETHKYAEHGLDWPSAAAKV